MRAVPSTQGVSCCGAVFGPLECNKHPVYEPVTLSAEDVMGYIPVTRELMQLFGRVTPEWLSSTILGLR